jgi:hypothetical protein
VKEEKEEIEAEIEVATKAVETVVETVEKELHLVLLLKENVEAKSLEANSQILRYSHF